MNEKMKNRANRRAMYATVAIIAFAYLSFFLGNPVSLPVLLLTAVAWGLVYIAFDRFLNRKNACYTKRIEANDATPWDVYLNGVKVGTITDAEYADIQQYAFRDIRNAVGQFCNTGGIILRILSKMIFLVPLVAFWGVVGLGIFAPESYIETMRTFQQANAAEVTAFVQSLLQLIVLAALLAIGASVMFGVKFGFKNFYSAAVAQMIRQHCNTPAEGDIHLSRMVEADLLSSPSVTYTGK